MTRAPPRLSFDNHSCVEGDLVETVEGLICDVKGLVHPRDRVVAFPRFVPDPQGERTRGGVGYRKVYPLTDRFELLRDRYPRYLRFDPVFGRNMSEIPLSSISKIYKPVQKVRELRKQKRLDRVERDALDFVSILRDSSGINRESIGISGSVLVGLQTPRSDIDPVIYGVRNCPLARRKVDELLNEDREIKRYSEKELRRLFEFRSQDTVMPFQDFAQHERRKTIQGTFRGRAFFIRYVKGRDEVDEIYGDRVYRALGRAKVSATVTDDSESIFTPCSYGIADVRVLEGFEETSIAQIVSFRGRFCEQAKAGETVVAQGTLERVEFSHGGETNRLLLGSDREDSMIVTDHSSRCMSI